MRNVAFTLLLAALILALVTCPNPGGGGGSLVITLPAIAMQSVDPKDPPAVPPVSAYEILGVGPGSAGFQETGITETSVTIDSLAPGDWSVTVNGNSSDGVHVQSASLHARVVSGETTPAAVAASQLVSSGTLEISLNWSESLAYTSVVASLTPSGGVPRTITLPAITSGGGGSTVNASVAVPVGYYALSRVYSGKSGVAWGAANALRVTFARTTRLVLSTGVVTITPDISKVIPIDFKGQKTNFGRGEVATITATPVPQLSMKVISFSYQWYLNGEPIESVPREDTLSSTVTIDMNNAPGSCRLDVVVSADGTLCSDGLTFTVAGG